MMRSVGLTRQEDNIHLQISVGKKRWPVLPGIIKSRYTLERSRNGVDEAPRSCLLEY